MGEGPRRSLFVGCRVRDGSFVTSLQYFGNRCRERSRWVVSDHFILKEGSWVGKILIRQGCDYFTHRN